MRILGIIVWTAKKKNVNLWWQWFCNLLWLGLRNLRNDFNKKAELTPGLARDSSARQSRHLAINCELDSWTAILTV